MFLPLFGELAVNTLWQIELTGGCWFEEQFCWSLCSGAEELFCMDCGGTDLSAFAETRGTKPGATVGCCCFYLEVIYLIVYIICMQINMA